MMNCPNCRNSLLLAQELEPGLIAATCELCEGALLPLLNYRYWVEGRFWADGVLEHAPKPDEVVAEDTDHVVLCAKCQRMMIKYRIGLEPSNKIDLCANCDEVWLDRNEWELLKSVGIHHQLPSILTDSWQRNLRRERQNELLQARYRKLLGDSDLERLNDFKAWLDQHPEKNQIKQFLLASI